jgi:hypothetical protein
MTDKPPRGKPPVRSGSPPGAHELKLVAIDRAKNRAEM